MKAMKKVLALALALAMVVTAVPVTSAEAATLTAGKSKKITYYVGKTNTVKLSGVKASKVKSTTWSKNGSTAVNLKSKAKTSVKVQVVKAGTAKVTANVKLKSGKTKKYTLNITTKNPTITAASAKIVAVGDKISVKATGVKPASATVEYSVVDPAVATVDAKTGEVTGVKAGTTKVTAKLTCGTTVKEVTTDVTVKKVILKDAKQTEVTKIAATVAGDSKDLKAGDFKITNTATNGTVAVKSATADKNDPTKITIETFTEMKDAKEYNVTFDGVTVKFTATDGTPAKVGIDKAQIPAASKEKIQAVLSDANDVVLSRTDINANNFSKGNVTSAVTLTKGYQDGSSIYLPAVGDTASIKVTYHTGTFGTDGKEAGNIEDTFTVTAVDPSLVNYNFAVTIGAAPAWTAASFQSNDKIKMGDNRNAYFRITKDDGSEIAAENYADYTVESADKTKLLVTNTKLTNSSTAVPVHGVAEGSTYILVKKDDKVVASLPVTVLGKPVATSLELSRTSVTICTNSAVDEVVNVTIKDQYGDAMTTSGTAPTPTVTLLAKPDKAKTVTAAIGGTVSQVATAAGKVTIKGQTFATDNDDLGSYTLKITSEFGGKKLDRTLNVNVVKNAATTQSYEVRIDTPEVDTTVGATDTVSDTSKQIKISVAKMANGGAMDEVSEVIYTIKNAKGDVIAHVGETISGTVAGAVKEDIGTVVSCAAVSSDHNAVDADGYSSGSLTVRPYNVDSGKIVKNLAAGTYTVEAKVLSDDEKKVVTVNGSFTIKDTQDSRVSFKLLKNDFDTDDVATAFAYPVASGKQVVKVYYDGIEQDNSKLDVTDVKGVALTNGGAYIKTVKVFVNVSGGTNYVQITLNVNDQIAKCAPTGITE